MSEAIATKPQDFPAIDTPQNRVNIRKALAGLYLLQGRGSMKRCLIDAGYSRATARLVTQNGLSAQQCLDETAKLNANANPAKLLELGRSRAMFVIEAIDPKTVRLGDAIKMLDTVEKFYGGHQIPPSMAGVALAERLAGIAALLAVARERGLPVPPAASSYLEAEIVAKVPESSEVAITTQSQDAENKGDNAFGSGKRGYVNPNW